MPPPATYEMLAAATVSGSASDLWPKIATPRETRLSLRSRENSPPLAFPAPRMRVPPQLGHSPEETKRGCSGGGGNVGPGFGCEAAKPKHWALGGCFRSSPGESFRDVLHLSIARTGPKPVNNRLFRQSTTRAGAWHAATRTGADTWHRATSAEDPGSCPNSTGED